MLRNRSRAAVSSKQALGSERSSISTPAQDKTNKQISSFLGSPRFFGSFLTKAKGGEFDALMCATSTLGMKSVFPNDKPFGYCENIQSSPRTSTKKRPWETSKPTAIGLALVTFPDETPAGEHYNSATRMVTFAPHLKVHVPPNLPPTYLSLSADSPSDFGTKTRNQQLTSPQYLFQTGNSPVNTSSLSVAEMELSEDYTRVISRGPNQTTTHIFDNCVVKSCGFVNGCSNTSTKKTKNLSPVAKSLVSHNFLSRCYTCKKNLSHKKDIYMYRGEKAFCSHVCRGEEMLKDGVDYDD